MPNSQSATRHILEEIVLYKVKEVAQMQEELPLASVQQQLEESPPIRNFLTALQQSPYQPSLIAEVKKASPSRGIIREDFDAAEIACAYESSGAACISVLTDEKFFQGGFENLRRVRSSVELPVLCKEFIIKPYQIYFARHNGADAILLIAAILSDFQLQSFLEIIHGLGMTALVEVHTLAELDRVLKLDGVSLIGINNRNLENFSLDIRVTKELLMQRQQQIQDLNITIVSESGLYTSDDLAFVAASGARAVLVGESLVKQPDIKRAVRHLLGNTLK
jgi:indole-3-glycerol phosphate synthase